MLIPRRVGSRMEDVLNESTQARKYALALKHVDYSGDLVDKLMKHSKKLEGIYNTLNGLKKQGSRDNDRYEKFYKIIDHMHSFWEKAEAWGLHNNKPKSSHG